MAPDFRDKDNPINSDSALVESSCFRELTEISSGPESEEVLSRLKAPRFNPRTVLAGLTKYGLTGGFNLLSSSGLEAVTLAGATFAAGINPLASLDTKYAIAALACSYIPVVTGILQNASQAWQSLKETGVSVNLPAKIGFDLSRKITANEKIQKFATYTGFVGLELMKEVPWYMGAFAGKEIMSDWVPQRYTPNIEYAFLAGANLFGAAYFYAQAGGVEAILTGIRNRERILNIFRFDQRDTKDKEIRGEK